MNALLSDLPASVCDDGSRTAAEIRTWIVTMLARILGVDPVSIDTAAPLHSLGASSLVAITMTGDLAQWLNRDLPATLMWDHPSIDALAAALSTRASQPIIPPGVVAWQADGDRPPLFCFPGAGGHSTTFAPLVAHLGPQQPAYGLIVPGINGEREPFETVEDITATMLEAVRQVQPHGPYQFAGYSFGGLLAYEAAQQMCAAGEKVSLLAIYDTFTPAGHVLRPRWQRVLLHAYFLATRMGRMQYIRGQLERRREEHELRASLKRYAEADPELRKRPALHVEDVNTRAGERYEPRPYPGAITLYRAAQRTQAAAFYKLELSYNGWGTLAPGRVEVIELPGTHRSMLDPEYAQTAAAALQGLMASNNQAPLAARSCSKVTTPSP
jgi:thioesterase domain-containing protein/acyl carrier protein